MYIHIIKNEWTSKYLLQYIKMCCLLIIFSSCTPEAEYIPIDDRIGALPKIIIDPINNPTSPEKIALGRALFWDPILSGNKDVACVTCHHPSKGYAEHIDLSLGVGGRGLSENREGGTLVKRNAPTILNTAFNGIGVTGTYDPLNTVMFWDNRSISLEEQSLGPILSMEEMRGDVYTEENAVAIVSERLSDIPVYVTMFNAAFGTNTIINGDKISKAIAAFERSLVANNSRFDQYARGNTAALTQEEVRGMNAFVEAKCTACHSGPMFTDFELHDLGVPDNSKLAIVDDGINGKFRTPSLRNLPQTGPYFHNGTIKTLRDAVGFYNRIEINDDAARELNFDGDMIDSIVAFLQALNDDDFDKTIPESVPSGLPVGGNIQ